MGNGMNKVLPGLYVGNYRDSKDQQQLNKNQITHIIAIHDSPRRLLADKHYLCVMAADTPDQNLSQYFSVCNDFIHAARLREGNVLIHCLAGMSRSVTVAVAYIMTATNLNWKEALKVVRAGRAVANPNAGFQTQLQEFEMYRLAEERRRLRERFPSTAMEQLDRSKCMSALTNYAELLHNKDICEGNCTRGEKCPTGVCNMDPSKGLFRRRTSTASMRSRLRTAPAAAATSTTTGAGGTTAAAQSCPTSPKHSPTVSRRSLGDSKILEDEEILDVMTEMSMVMGVGASQKNTNIDKNNEATTSEAAAYAAAITASKIEQQQRDSNKTFYKKSPTNKSTAKVSPTIKPASTTTASTSASSSAQSRVSSAGSRLSTTRLERNDSVAAAAAAGSQLQRSASTVSGLATVRPRSIPGGLYSYTGNSIPSSLSVHGSRIDLQDDKGSVVYLGCSAPRNSTMSLTSRSSSQAGSSVPTSPARTPPVSPRHAQSAKRSTSVTKKQIQQQR